MTASALAESTREVRRPEFAVARADTQLAGAWEGLAPGQVLGQFRVERRLGRGGMNSVFLARHVNGGAKVAIKTPNVELAHDLEVRERLLTEGRILTALRHPNIATVFDTVMGPQGVPYLVMEYLEGSPLRRGEGEPMDVQPVVHVLGQLCEALEAAHARGVVHRDVKPENIFLVRRLDAPLTVKLLDFGIARVDGDFSRKHSTAMGSVLGTPDFMAPEQMMGEEVDGRADLYAVGVVGFLLLTGKLPFASLRQKVFKAPPRVTTLRSDVPPALAELLASALMPDPAQRCSSAAQLREALAGVLAARNPPGRFVATLQPLAASVYDLQGRALLTCESALVVPGGAWLCTEDALPAPDRQVLVTLPGHDGFLAARVVATQAMSPTVRASLPRGFLVEFPRLETSARKALAALAPRAEPARR